MQETLSVRRILATVIMGASPIVGISIAIFGKGLQAPMLPPPGEASIALGALATVVLLGAGFLLWGLRPRFLVYFVPFALVSVALATYGLPALGLSLLVLATVLIIQLRRNRHQVR